MRYKLGDNFFFVLTCRVKLDDKSIENGFEIRNVRFGVFSNTTLSRFFLSDIFIGAARADTWHNIY